MKEQFINDTNYFDQHFLIDKSIINTFIDEARLNVNETVVEIGPGKGEMSDVFARRSKHLTCIELDTKLEPFLNVLQDKHDNVEVIYASALDAYIPKCDKIISALPYSITEPFIEKLLRCDFNEALLIVGKRFADSVVDEKINKLAENSIFPQRSNITIDNIKNILDIINHELNTDDKEKIWNENVSLLPYQNHSLLFFRF